MSDTGRDDEPETGRPGAGWLSEYRGLLGILFVVALIGLAIVMIERMRHYAALGDCAFTASPACRQLLDR